MSLKTASQNRVSNFTFTNSRSGGGGIGAGSVVITSIIITDSNFNNLDDTAVATANSYIRIVGTGFSSSANVFVSGSKVISNNVTYVNSTELRVALPTASGYGNTNIFVFNPDNSGAIWAPGLLISGTPDFLQQSYTTSTPLSVSVQLLATGDVPLTYQLQSGSTLPAGLTLSSSGLISGSTVDGVYQFTVVVSDAQLQSFQSTITLTVTSTDEYFNRTVLAINADTDTFVRDASNNNFAITVNGDTKPYAFSPYNTSWSNYFNNNPSGSQILFVPDSDAFNFGSGDFTVEAFIYRTSTRSGGGSGTGSQSGTVYAQCQNVANNGNRSHGMNVNDSAFQFYYSTNGSTDSFISWSYTFNLNQWYHVAISRSGNLIYGFVDGQLVSSQAFTATIFNSSASLAIGGFGRYPIDDGYTLLTFGGYISNLRLIKGTAVYTSAFTLPTTHLTAITNTSLLTCQSNRLIDNSTNNLAITKNGDVKVTAFGPFTETDTTTGSGYFDGTGDNLQVVNNAAFQFGSENFTIEFFAYFNSVAVGHTPLSMWSSSQYQFSFYTSAIGVLSYYLSSNGTTWNIASGVSCGSISVGQWIHVALVRNGSTFTPYLNGVAGTTTTSASALHNSTAFVTVGSGNGVDYFNGHISNVRIIKGTAVYTSAFTPPTAGLTAVANTSLLTLQTRQPVNNHSFIDQSGLNNIVTRNGNPSQGSFSPFSPAKRSVYFDGSGDTLTLSRTVLTNLSAASAWTIEFWAYKTATSASAYSLIMSTDASGNVNGTVFSLNNANFVVGGQGHAGFPQLSTPANSTSVNRWHHIAVVKNSGTLKIYIDGIERASNVQSTTFPNVADLMLGNRSSADLPFTGYISNLRVVNGTAVYTSAFTPPTAELTAVANTSLLTCQSNRFIDNSTNNFTITRNGDTKVVNFSPFKPSAIYSPTTHGGSAYFDGSDYLQTNSTDSGLIRTGPFTIELWVYPLSLNTTLLSRFYWQTGDNGGWTLSTNSSGFVAFGYSTGAWNSSGGLTATSNPVLINQWNHIAVTRDTSNTLRIFVNGNSAVTPITLTQSLDTVAVQQAAVQPRTFRVGVSGLGDGALSGYYTGYISSVKIQTGVAKYTANSIPALQTFSNESGINYLSNMNTIGIFDNSSRNFIETVGDAKIRTDIKKYGTGSMYFDGTGDYLVLTGNVDNFVFGVGDFTIEFWLYLNANQTSIVYDQRASGAQGLYPELYINANSIRYYTNSADRIVGATLNNQQWYHIALARSGTATKLFVNGTQSGSTYTDSNNYINGTNRPVIGASASSLGSDPFNGYIDDLRITKGVARYTTNFNAPTSTFLTQ